VFSTTAEGMVRYTAQDWIVPISDAFDVGDMISTVDVVVMDNDQSTVTLETFFDIIGDSSGVIGTPLTVTSNATFTPQLLSQTGLNHTIQPLDTVTIHLTAAGPNPVQVGTINIGYLKGTVGAAVTHRPISHP
jgi:hypothetical protein